MIWATDIVERKNTKKVGGSLLGGGQKVTEYRYYGNFAVALGEGPASGVLRIWAGEKLIADLTAPAFDGTAEDALRQLIGNSRYRFRVYLGDEDQEPDPLIEAKVEEEHGQENITPAFRGLVYIVFEELPLDEFGNRLPPITAEVAWAGQDELPERVFDPIPLSESIFPNTLNTAGNGLVNFQLGYRVEFRNGNIQVGGFPGLRRFRLFDGIEDLQIAAEDVTRRRQQLHAHVLQRRRRHLLRAGLHLVDGRPDQLGDPARDPAGVRHPGRGPGHGGHARLPPRRALRLHHHLGLHRLRRRAADRADRRHHPTDLRGGQRGLRHLQLHRRRGRPRGAGLRRDLDHRDGERLGVGGPDPPSYPALRGQRRRRSRRDFPQRVPGGRRRGGGGRRHALEPLRPGLRHRGRRGPVLRPDQHRQRLHGEVHRGGRRAVGHADPRARHAPPVPVHQPRAGRLSGRSDLQDRHPLRHDHLRPDRVDRL